MYRIVISNFELHFSLSLQLLYLLYFYYHHSYYYY